jgi:hypothetical protein
VRGEWHGGKGPAYRPESERGAFSRGYDNINWNARSESVGILENAENEVSKAIDSLIENPTIPIPHLSAHPTGSRFTVTPPVLDTDDDWLVLVENLDAATNALIESDDWAPDLDGKYEVDMGFSWRFRSFRGPNKVNLIVTDDKTMYLRSIGATLIAKQLNLVEKEQRIALFREMRFGGWSPDDDIFATEHYEGPLP